jgi:twitching motility protein PilT
MHEQRDIDRYISYAWQRGASDILLLAGSPPKVRVDGDMCSITHEPILTGTTILEHLSQMLGPSKLAELRDEYEVDFTLSWQDQVRVRGNAFYQRGLPTVALRLIPDRVPSFDALRLPQAVRNLAALNQGLVLFTGPTGSGKSTSMAAMVDWINANRACHILTIEDPIEFVHRRKLAAISQREVGADTRSFAKALRAALREDPDVILVGEMRDPESIAITLTLAETGHLVLSTLHTNDASQALDRIVDVFDAERQGQVRLQLASSLLGVVAQRLAPRIGGGMTAAFEVLIGTSAVRNLVREGKTRQIRNTLTLGQAEGMQTLEMSLNSLVKAGVITYDDAVARAVVPDEIERPVLAPPSGRRRH